MARMAQGLRVAIVVCATFSQRDDVIALRCQRGAALLLAQHTQRAAGKQGGTHGLQSPAGHTLGGGHWLGPLCLGMLGAAACAITHQDAAAGVTTGFWCSGWHRVGVLVTVSSAVIRCRLLPVEYGELTLLGACQALGVQRSVRCLPCTNKKPRQACV